MEANTRPSRVPVTDSDDDDEAGGDLERSGRDYTKFDVKVGETKHEALAKRMAIFTIVKHLCGQGVTPDDIESWRTLAIQHVQQGGRGLG